MQVTFKFSLGNPVTVVANGRDGTIVGLWVSRSGSLWASAEYADGTGVIHNDWFPDSGDALVAKPVKS